MASGPPGVVVGANVRPEGAVADAKEPVPAEVVGARCCAAIFAAAAAAFPSCNRKEPVRGGGGATAKTEGAKGEGELDE